MSPRKRSKAERVSGQPRRARQRRTITFTEKLQILDMLDEGKKQAAVARELSLSESTIRTIANNATNIRAAAKISLGREVNRARTSRNEAVLRTESALVAWIHECQAKAIPLDTNIIQEKAKQLCDEVIATTPSQSQLICSPGFKASKGWFDRFRKRHSLRNVSLHGEAASADSTLAEDYVRHRFPQILSEGCFAPEQVFNMDETGLFWKKSPSRTYALDEPSEIRGMKLLKDRLTLVLCGNADGLLLKPSVIYRSGNPRALRNKNKRLLPVHWMHNARAWMTRELTAEWFYDSFIPQVELYLARKGLAFKVLLLLDNASGHSRDISYEGVRVEFLPPNTTSLIQPMDQGVIRALKALYMRSSLKTLVRSMDADENFSLQEHWRRYNIATCLSNLQAALDDMKQSTVRASWKNLWPAIVQSSDNSDRQDLFDTAVQHIVKLGSHIEGVDFYHLSREDVQNVLESDSSEFDQEEEREDQSESDGDGDGEVPPETGLTDERLLQLIRTVRDLQNKVESWDPHMIRALRFRKVLDEAIEPFKSLLRDADLL